jgi:hypothetical protein
VRILPNFSRFKGTKKVKIDSSTPMNIIEKLIDKFKKSQNFAFSSIS